MPLDTIFVARHGHRLNWSLDPQTGQYRSSYPTPTAIVIDPALTVAGVQQAQELGDYINGDGFAALGPRPCRVYCSHFYRCVQTIQPSVAKLKERQEREKRGYVDLDVRLEAGIGEWFGSSRTFAHPAPPSKAVVGEHFPNIVPASTSKFQQREPLITPSPNGETIAELHDRVAVALDAIIGEVDAEIADYEAHHPEEIHRSKAILLCSHAAPIIAMGRALTGNTPRNAFERDFKPFVAGLFKFVRRRRMSAGDAATCADETGKGGSGVVVPDWKNNKGVRGGWDCVVNGSCEHLNEGEGRVWFFAGEEDFLSTPAPAPTPAPTPAPAPGTTTATTTVPSGLSNQPGDSGCPPRGKI